MKIATVGTGYVGLVTGTYFLEMGVDATCVDVMTEKIENLKKGVIPIYEPGLEDMVHKNYDAGRLRLTTDLSSVLDDVKVVFSAVSTPPDEDSSADLRYVLEVAHTVGQHINKRTLIVTKSTVPVGTARKVKAAIQEELDKRGVSVGFDVASNPEFLREGNAVDDLMKLDHVMVGVESNRARKLMEELYKPFMTNNYRLIFTNVLSAEMIKYVANSMLATRISFMNDTANFCGLMGADVNMVRKGIGSDSRIGSKFLYPGCGYGGPCFPKDIEASIKTAEKNGYTMNVLRTVEEMNEKQKSVLPHKLQKHISNLSGKTVALWGLAFKPETGDMREATSSILVDLLTKAGTTVRMYDPIAMAERRRRLGDKVVYASDMYDATVDADALLLVTGWKGFRIPSWAVPKRLIRNSLLVDGRNIYNTHELHEASFIYECIGKL